MTSDPLLAASVCGVAAAAAGLLVPRLIAALPEPAADPEGEHEPVAETEPDGSVGAPAVPAAAAAMAPPVPPKVPYVELAARPRLGGWCALAAGTFAAAMGASRGWVPDLPVWVVLAVLGVTLGYIDWRTRLLPARLVVPAYPLVAVLIGVAAAVGWDDGGQAGLVRAGISWLLVFAIFFVLWFVYPRGLGYGDVRLSGVLGMSLGWLGADAVVLGMYAGFLLGAVIGGVLALARVVDRKGYPFGPFLLLGAFLGVLHADGHLLFWR